MDSPEPGLDRSFAKAALLLLLFAVHALLVLPTFFPTFNTMNLYDEAWYIHTGFQIAHGEVPLLAQSPLTAFLYTPVYFIVSSSPFWMIHCCGIIRMILFCLLWCGAYIVAKQFARWSNPLIAMALLAVTPALPSLLTFPSDASFAICSAFGLWQMLCFYRTRRYRHLWAASSIAALSALARSDGLVLLPVLVVLAVLIGRRRLSFVGIMSATVLPFVLLVGGYLLLCRISHGRFETGIRHRQYEAFEQGHGVVYAEQYSPNFYLNGQLDARRIYGTPEENDYLVFNAVRRNPTAYMKRLVRMVLNLPKTALLAYGSGVGVVIILFALRGLLRMTKEEALVPVAIALAWNANLLAYLLSFYREGYLLLPYAFTVTMAGIGLSTVLDPANRKREMPVWSGVLLLLAILAFATNHKNAWPATLAVAAALPIAAAISATFQSFRNPTVPPFVVLFILACVSQTFPSRPTRSLGKEPTEKAVLYLAENMEPGSRIASFTPGVIWASRMYFIPVHKGLPEDMDPDEVFEKWLDNARADAIYIDAYFIECRPEICDLFERHIGRELMEVFREEDVRILLVRRSIPAEKG